MTTPLILLASLALAQGRPGMVTEPGTDAPQSVNWGPDYKEKVQKVFDKLMLVSGYDNDIHKEPDINCQSTPDPMRTKTRLIYSDKFQTIEGSPAVAVPACVPPNENNYSIVAAGYGLLEFVHNEDELAFIFGHEITHLAMNHGGQKVAKRMKLFEEWYDANEAKVQGMKTADVVKAFERKHGSELHEEEKKFEHEADANGQNLMTLAKFDPDKASVSLKRAQDWLWAIGQKAPDLQHDPLWVRAKQLHEWNTARELRQGEASLEKLGLKAGQKAPF